MGAMSPKFPDLEAYNNALNTNGLLNALPFLGTQFDPILRKHVMDGGWKIVTDIDDLKIGDKAVAGNSEGIVTAIYDDGAATNNRIEVTFNTPFIQNFGDTTVSDRIRVYNVLSNDEASATSGQERLEVNNALNGLGVVFLQEAKIVAAAAISQVVVADGAGTANGADTELVTVTVYGSNGAAKTVGGDTVSLASTLSGVVSAVTDVGDGTYTATVTNTVAETTTITATINGVECPDTEDIVWT